MSTASLNRINDFLNSSLELDSLLILIMEQSRKALKAQASSLALYEPKTKDLYFKVALGNKGKKLENLRLKIGQGLTGTCAKNKKVINVADVAKDKRWAQSFDQVTGFKTKSILAIPMVFKGKLIGVIEVLNKKNGKAFSKEDVSLLKVIGTEAAMAIKNAQLIEANRHQAQLAAVGNAIAGLAHYIKNLQLGVSGGSAIVDIGLKKKDFSILKKGWRLVQRNEERVTQLVRDMLYYCSNKKLEKSKLNLNELIKEVADSLKQTATEKKIKLVLHSEKRSCLILADAISIHRALLNLVGNALDAFDNQPGTITLTLKRLNNKALIEIKDTGVGIAKENLNKIFDPFFTTKGHAGTGIGLAVTKKIIEEHRGKLTLKSEKGAGTAVLLTLPILKKN